MKSFGPILIVLVLSIFGYTIVKAYVDSTEAIDQPIVEEITSRLPDLGEYNWIYEWQRPQGPPRVGLQVGHLENSQFPEELSELIGNTGASAGGVNEVEINEQIANLAAKKLESRGIVVDVLPATVPQSYWADAFVALHADGSTDRSASGYKVSPPWRDMSGGASLLSTIFEDKYGQATQLRNDPNITRNMRGYYAFAWWRYDHAIHPMTPAVILEMGFVTNPGDRAFLVSQPDLIATAISDSVIEFLQQRGVMEG